MVHAPLPAARLRTILQWFRNSASEHAFDMFRTSLRWRGDNVFQTFNTLS